MVEETTAVSHNLAGEATSLIELLRQFKLGQSVGHVKKAAAPAMARSAPASPARQVRKTVSAAFAQQRQCGHRSGQLGRVLIHDCITGREFLGDRFPRPGDANLFHPACFITNKVPTNLQGLWHF